MTTELEKLITQWVSRTENRIKALEHEVKVLCSEMATVKQKVGEIGVRVGSLESGNLEFCQPEPLRLVKRIEEIARRVHDLERGESPHQELFEYVESLEHKINGLSFRTANTVQRLNALDATNKEAIEQAIGLAAYENGEDHL